MNGPEHTASKSEPSEPGSAPPCDIPGTVFAAELLGALDAHALACVVSPAGRILFANTRLCQISGYTAAELQGRSYRILESRHQSRTLLKSLFGAVKRCERWQGDILNRTRDGREFWVQTTVVPVVDETGHPLRFVVIGTEITEKKIAAAELNEKELQLRTLFEHAPIGIAWRRVNKASECCFANGNFRRIAGIATEAVDLDAMAGLAHPEDRERETELARQLHAGDISSFTIDQRFRREDGSFYWAQITKTLIRSSDGQPLQEIAILADINEQKIGEIDRQKFVSLIEHSGDLIMMTAPDLRIRYMNAAGRALTGMNAEADYRSHSALDLCAPAHREYFEYSVLPEVRRTGRWEGEIQLRNSTENRVFDAHLNSFVIADPVSGLPVCLAFVVRDLSEWKRAENDLLGAIKQAESANKSKSAFIATMSHEIRTPMNGIIGMVGLLLQTELKREQREFAETIRQSADNLLTIINDILDFSKIEAGKLTFENIPFNLRSTVEEAIEILAGLASTKGIELISLVEQNVPVNLLGDPGRLRQVLSNLVNNALKFTEKGEVAVRVELVEQSEDESCMRFTVRDTGIGIPADKQKILFKPFTQADSSMSRRYGGTGLGLVISKQLVECMGGEIGFSSVEGQGSSFWFTIRLKKQIDTPQTGDVKTEPLRGLRMLVVDDNETNRKILSYQLRSWGVEYSMAENGRLAWELLEETQKAGLHFHAAILDGMMPEMDGITLATKINADRRFARMKKILLSSFNNKLTEEEMKQTGIDASLLKPIRQERLFDVLREVLNRPGRDAHNDTSKGGKSVGDDLGLTPAERAKVRILVAEDNVVNQKVALHQLKNLGFKADAVANGKEAVDAHLKMKYHIILMDCQMPEMDGFEASRTIRAWEARSQPTQNPLPPVYIVAITANAMVQDRINCLASGMNDYVSKPVNVKKLTEALRRGIEFRQP